MNKSISDLRKDIQEYRQLVLEAEKQIAEAQKHCPHPDYFVKVVEKDIYDNSVCGPALYEYTSIVYCCSLCEGSFFGKYDKDSCKKPTLKWLLASTPI